jgi:hypothetical protein
LIYSHILTKNSHRIKSTADCPPFNLHFPWLCRIKFTAATSSHQIHQAAGDANHSSPILVKNIAKTLENHRYDRYDLLALGQRCLDGHGMMTKRHLLMFSP